MIEANSRGFIGSVIAVCAGVAARFRRAPVTRVACGPAPIKVDQIVSVCGDGWIVVNYPQRFHPKQTVSIFRKGGNWDGRSVVRVSDIDEERNMISVDRCARWIAAGDGLYVNIPDGFISA